MTDKLGVYRVGDLKFHSKLQAIEMHTKTGIHPHWDFNESVFDCYDWTQEPTESLAELYRQRAEQLRNQYDFIVLVYSSGADSQNVLNSFVDNDIKLDEVVSMVNYEGSDQKHSRFNKEIFEQAVPTIKQLQDRCPWIKHRIVDLCQGQIDYFNSSPARFDWIYSVNLFWTSNNAGMISLGTRFKKWRDLINQGKKLCLLWGFDKPRVLHENNRFCFRFIDIIDNGPGVTGLSGQHTYSDEAFYWTPDLPKIVIKQAHVIRRYLNTHTFTSPYISTKKTDLAYKTVDDKKYWLDMNGLHQLIYPNYTNQLVTTSKGIKMVYGDRDIWFRNMEESNRALQVWQMGVDKLWKTVPDYWKNDPNNIDAGIKACWSKSYYLD